MPQMKAFSQRTLNVLLGSVTMRSLSLAANCTQFSAPGGPCWDQQDGQANSAAWAFLFSQNQDGVCVQSVSVILHQDPRRQVTLTQAGDVLLFDQYKVTPPYTDGTALVDESGLGAVPRLLPGSSGQRHCHLGKSSNSNPGWIRPGAPWSQEHGFWTLK